jgi:peptidoglycan/xylan/chitin deacetylase (PgdA/CDA1 family)
MLVQDGVLERKIAAHHQRPDGSELAVLASIQLRATSVIRAVGFVILFLLTHASLLLLFHFSFSRFLLFVAFYSAGTLLMLYLLFHPRSQWLVTNRSRVDSNGRRCVSLTFDDGPNPLRTPRLLEVLRKSNVQATFFVVGKEVEQYPELVHRAIADGHLIANHTYSHPVLFCFLTPWRLRSEIEKGQDAIERICGHRPCYFRSPVGLRHPLLSLYLEQARLEYVSWTIRSFDTLVPQAEAILDRILRRVTPGDIILLHDNASAGSEVMLDVLPRMIDKLKERGFEFVPVGAVQPSAVTA